MMPLSSAVAAFINARMSAECRRRLRAHSDAAIALCAGPVRLCFRLDGGGGWRPASPLIDAEVCARWTPGGDMQVSGNGALLRDLDEVWRCCAPGAALYDLLSAACGAQAADFAADAAAKADIKNMPVKCGIAAPPNAVADFNKQTAALNIKTAALRARLSSLENSYV